MIRCILTEHEKREPDPDLRLQAQAGAPQEALQRTIVTLRQRRQLDVREYRTGLSIQTFAHVGRVRVGDLTIIIKPKLAERDFLSLLGYVHELDDLDLRGLTWFDTTGSAVQELFIAQLQARVRDVLRRGVARRYRAQAEALASPRGKLDVRRRAGSGRMMGAQLPCIHHTRSADQLLNAVLLSGITLGSRLTSSPLRRAELRELEQRLSAEVQPARLGAHVFRAARAQLNRLVVGYERPIQLIEMLHTCSGASWQDDASVELDGFLFDMNSFFQKLLRLFLNAYLPSGCEVQHEAPLHDLFRYSVNPKNERPPKPRPDFTVRRGARMWLLDAKYRDLWCKGLPVSMLYQLSVYALSQGQGATAAILYPTESPGACEEVLTICAPRTGIALGQVALRPVLMSQLVSVLSAPTSDGAQALARYLAFGGDRAHSLPEPAHAQRTLLTSSLEP